MRSADVPGTTSLVRESAIRSAIVRVLSILKDYQNARRPQPLFCSERRGYLFGRRLECLTSPSESSEGSHLRHPRQYCRLTFSYPTWSCDRPAPMASHLPAEDGRLQHPRLESRLWRRRSSAVTNGFPVHTFEGAVCRLLRFAFAAPAVIVMKRRRRPVALQFLDGQAVEGGRPLPPDGFQPFVQAGRVSVSG